MFITKEGNLPAAVRTNPFGKTRALRPKQTRVMESWNQYSAPEPRRSRGMMPKNASFNKKKFINREKPSLKSEAAQEQTEWAKGKYTSLYY